MLKYLLLMNYSHSLLFMSSNRQKKTFSYALS